MLQIIECGNVGEKSRRDLHFSGIQEETTWAGKLRIMSNDWLDGSSNESSEARERDKSRLKGVKQRKRDQATKWLWPNRRYPRTKEPCEIAWKLVLSAMN